MLLAILISLIISVIILTIYFRKRPLQLPTIIAGDVEGVVSSGITKSFKGFDIFLYKNRLFNSKKDFMGTIGGNSMNARGLKKGDIVFGKKYHDGLEIKRGDLLIIEITDRRNKNCGSLKIREFEDFGEKPGMISTSKYEGYKRGPSGPHRLKDVRAIVDHYIKSK